MLVFRWYPNENNIRNSKGERQKSDLNNRCGSGGTGQNHPSVMTKELFISRTKLMYRASPVAQWLKKEEKKKYPPEMQEMQETRVWSLGQEDPLKKEVVTHSSTLVWRIPWTEEPGRLWSMGLQRVRHN